PDRSDQPLLLVIAQRRGRDARTPGYFVDIHAAPLTSSRLEVALWRTRSMSARSRGHHDHFRGYVDHRNRRNGIHGFVGSGAQAAHGRPAAGLRAGRAMVRAYAIWTVSP